MGQFAGHASSYSVNLFSSSFVTLVEGKVEATQALRGFVKQAEKGSSHLHPQKIIVTSVPKSP